jgi:nucleoside 2-deoxyribosyltransferase
MKQVPLKLKKLPSILALNKFNKYGLVSEWQPCNKDDKGVHVVHLKEGLIFSSDKYDSFVPAYVASQLGFNTPGKYFLQEFFYPALLERGVLPLCPFAACVDYLDQKVFYENLSVKKNKQLWDNFNKNIVPEVNYNTLMPKAKFLIAILDGGHAADDGVCAEIGYYAREFPMRPIIGIRSDFRLSENPAATVNPAVSHFVTQLFEGPEAYQHALTSIKTLSEKIREYARVSK